MIVLDTKSCRLQKTTITFSLHAAIKKELLNYKPNKTREIYVAIKKLPFAQPY